MKKLLSMLAAILCLVLVYHLGAAKALGQAPQVRSFDNYFYEYQGGYWRNNAGEWDQYPTPTVPPDQVLWYSGDQFITTSGELFNWTGTWVSAGSIPGTGPTPANRVSFGQLKARYR